MAGITIRNLSEATHRALKARAAQHGRSMEAEIRDILDRAVRPTTDIRLGSELAAIARACGGFELEIERDKAPSPTVRF
ncbi:FitA-like ribbon-helix-helix domain-containing protein [Azorhizobium doebereinerae]|uniref:FitA-like ribbon-helix-helix domain-containing protein n=1 Tax=Azorhizobium doebereinerae TaxID=281091 RepID=UPI00048FD634|nr:hypothetical protein [Azorhizobium doebereinerae]